MSLVGVAIMHRHDPVDVRVHGIGAKGGKQFNYTHF